MYNFSMELTYYVFLFLSGLFAGSFLNVIADRSVSGESFLFGRSHCDKCGKLLNFPDLIPLLSFTLNRGKCRSCSTKLSFWYPISELITGIAFAGALYISKGFNIYFFLLVVMFSFFIILFLADAKYYLVPTKVIIPAIVFLFLFGVLSRVYALVEFYFRLKNDTLGRYLLNVGYWNVQAVYILKTYGIQVLSALLIALFFWFLVYITKGRGMGGGDILLGLLIGLFNDFPHNLLGIFLGFVFGAAFSLPLVLLKIKGMKDTVPFGPFLILGSIVALLFGPQLVEYYLKLF